MNDWISALTAQLDKDEPHWYITWADEHELRNFVRALLSASDRETRISRLKHAIAMRVFHRVINAAICAGIVKEC